jgi:hypothetical protein
MHALRYPGEAGERLYLCDQLCGGTKSTSVTEGYYSSERARGSMSPLR